MIKDKKKNFVIRKLNDNIGKPKELLGKNLGKNDEVNAASAKSKEETTRKQTTTIHKVITKAHQLPAPAKKAIITHK